MLGFYAPVTFIIIIARRRRASARVKRITVVMGSYRVGRGITCVYANVAVAVAFFVVVVVVSIVGSTFQKRR